MGLGWPVEPDVCSTQNGSWKLRQTSCYMDNEGRLPVAGARRLPLCSTLS